MVSFRLFLILPCLLQLASCQGDNELPFLDTHETFCCFGSCPHSLVNITLPSLKSCMGARNDDPAKFNITDDLEIMAMTLTRVNGSLFCSGLYQGFFGCNSPSDSDKMSILISSGNRNLMWPFFGVRKPQSFYKYAGNHRPYEQEIIRVDIQPGTLFVRQGTELWLWYGEDYNNFNENDNLGRMCVEITLHAFKTDTPVL